MHATKKARKQESIFQISLLLRNNKASKHIARTNTSKQERDNRTYCEYACFSECIVQCKQVARLPASESAGGQAGGIQESTQVIKQPSKLAIYRNA